MQEIVLDFRKCKEAKSEKELYRVIKEKVSYYFDYGNNPNALWDIMLDYWRRDEYIQFKLYGVGDLKYRYLQLEMKYILDVFQRIHKENNNVTFEIIS